MGGRSVDDGLEALCDLAAAELLFPAESFRADVADRQLSVDTMEEMADKYIGSLSAAAHDMIDLADRSALLVMLNEMNKPADKAHPGADPRLRVAYAIGSGDWPFVPKWKSAASAGPLARALRGEVVDEATTPFRTRSQHKQGGTCVGHALPIP